MPTAEMLWHFREWSKRFLVYSCWDSAWYNATYLCLKPCVVYVLLMSGFSLGLHPPCCCFIYWFCFQVANCPYTTKNTFVLLGFSQKLLWTSICMNMWLLLMCLLVLTALEASASGKFCWITLCHHDGVAIFVPLDSFFFFFLILFKDF